MRRFHYGRLTHENATAIRDEIIKLLANKLFVVAKVDVDNYSTIEVDAHQYIIPDWVDGAEDLVRVSKSDEFVTIHFCDCNYNYIFNSRSLTGTHNDNRSEPYFAFHDGRFTVKLELVPGRLKLYTFKVQGELPYDTSEYHERYLKIHDKEHRRTHPIKGATSGETSQNPSAEIILG
jgi:hypothetical protein